MSAKLHLFWRGLVALFLTLLVIPSFYDSIETSRDRAVAKFHRRAERRNVALAFVLTLLEAVLTLLLLRFFFRMMLRGGRRVFKGRGPTASTAAS